jgi:hypothetical protein
MTVLNNNFSGGPAGTMITTSNSGQFGDNAFNATGYSTTNPVEFYDVAANGLNRETAQFVMGITLVNTSGTAPYVYWSSSMGSQSQIWTRFYIYWTSIAQTTYDQIVFTTLSSITTTVSLYLQTSSATNQVLYLKDHGGNTAMFSQVITPGEWCRVELNINYSGSSAQGYLFIGANSDGDLSDYDDSATLSGASFGSSSSNLFAIGYPITISGETAALTYFSNWQLNNTGYAGPAPWYFQGSPGFLPNAVAPHTDIS